MALHFFKIPAVTIALEISYTDSPTNSFHKSTSHNYRIDE